MSDRPIECTGCQKPIRVIYKQIAQNAITEQSCCEECPVLAVFQDEESAKDLTSHKEVFICDHCQTSTEEMGQEKQVGCPSCYSAFEAVLTEEYRKNFALPKRCLSLLEADAKAPLHLGQIKPENSEGVPLSSQLQGLNEALNKALRKENYEEAAYIRDQIKGLIEGDDGQG
ncbi:MAG: UvrB/UvrC motif-containing protein [Simkaniaceae bacterium]